MSKIMKHKEMWQDEIESGENLNYKYACIGALIGFLIIISICFILGWVIV